MLIFIEYCKTVRCTVRQKLRVGKWKKIGILAFQKGAKTGNIGKKSPVAGSIDHVRYLSMQKVNALTVSLQKSTRPNRNRNAQFANGWFGLTKYSVCLKYEKMHLRLYCTCFTLNEQTCMPSDIFLNFYMGRGLTPLKRHACSAPRACGARFPKSSCALCLIFFHQLNLPVQSLGTTFKI